MILLPVPHEPANWPQPHPKPVGAFDITAYGADPTGVVDSFPAIKLAEAAAQAAGGGTVWTPVGDFLVSGPKTAHTVWITESGPNPIHWDGAGISVARWISQAPVGHVTLHLSAGSKFSHFTVDTAYFDGGVAIGFGAGSFGNSVGAVTGQTFGVRMISGTVPVHGPGAQINGLYLNDGAQPQLGAGAGGAVGWTAGIDIDYDDGFSLKNVIHIGSYCAVYYDGGSASPLGLIENYDYTPGDRAAPAIWRGLFLTQCENVSLEKVTLNPNALGVPGLRISRGVINQRITFDQIAGGKLVIGDVSELVVSNSTVDTVNFDPTVEAQGQFVATTHGLVSGLGPKVNVTGL